MNKLWLILFLSFIFFISVFLYILGPNYGNQYPVEIDIKKGMGLGEIADILDEKKIIYSGSVFKIYGALTFKSYNLKPGKYVFEKPVSVRELFKIFINGPKEISVVIFPGATIKEVDERLSALGIIEKNSLLKQKNPYQENLPLEGFLLPDTYYFLEGAGAEEAVEKIIDNFKDKALTMFDGKSKILRTLIMASLLEKEVPDYNDKRIVAGILEKRLASGIPFQVDATVVYVKCEGRFLNCPRIKKEDYKIDSPHNTYLYKGLPPTPISNPGIDSIKAALNPLDTDYWYYLSDPKTKKTIFSKNFNEHDFNRAKYLLNK